MNIIRELKNENFQNILKNSLTFKIYVIVRNFLFNAPVIKYFFDPYKLSPLWYNSFLFKASKLILKSLYSVITKINIPRIALPSHLFEHITGISILLSALVPDSIGLNGISGSHIALLPVLILWICVFIAKNEANHQSISFTAVFVILCVFYIAFSFGIKGGHKSGLILLIPILFFIIASFSLTVHSDSSITNSYIAITLIILSAIIIATAILKLPISNFTILYTDTIALLLPLAIARAINEDTKLKKTLYISTVILLSFIPVVLYGTPACKISYFISLFIIIMFIKPNLLIYILLITPTIVKYVTRYLINSLNSQIKYATPAENIISISRNLWSNALGSGYKPFLNVYNSFTENPQISDNILPIYINEGYLKIFYNIGFVLLFIFLWFTLKGMRSCLVNIFKSHGKRRIDSICAVSFLVGASISNFVAVQVTNLSISTLYRLILASIIKV